MHAQLKISMFGPFHVSGEEALSGVLEVLQAHAMAQHLLAFLLLHPDRAITKEDITTRLWGEGATIENLNKTIQKLRGAFGSDGVQLIEGRGSIGIRAEGLEVDSIALDRAWENRGQDIAPLVAAVEACDGPLLQGWDASWVVEARERYAERLRQSLHLLARYAIRDAHFQRAQHFLSRLRHAGDCAESLHSLLMEACLKAGAYPSAKQFFEEYRDFLRDRHALTPPGKMTEMYARIPKVKVEFEAPVESHLVDIEAPGGTMRLSSRFYVERQVDRDFHAALARRDGTLLINGPRQVGKSSLLARGGEQARQAGMRVVVTDFQKLDAENLQSIDAFFRALARTFQRKLALDVRPDDYWESRLSANENFDGYLQDVVLAKSAIPLVWCIDEADRIFDRDYRGSVFGLFRSWHNARAEEPDSLWNRFLLVMTYSTEARLFIPDLHQSPFNVGTRVTLEDFTPEQVRELNVRHESPLRTEAEIARLYRLVGGHPYLVRLCLYEMKAHSLTIDGLEAQADQDFGLFRDHLDRLYDAISQDTELSAGLRSLLDGGDLSPLAFVRLRSAGVATGAGAASARLRCDLYATWFRRRLA
jgi:DNA-binding SARP family transcriptional activator